MPKFIDRTGQQYGRLTVVAPAGRNALGKVLWVCQCACGATTVAVAGSLVTGNTTSCGCYLRERITKHGGWNKGSYNTWRAMVRRCTRPSDKDYPRYGAVGIKIAPEWMEYTRFAQDMGEPVGTETLDRIDPYGDYVPGNCRWAAIPTQARNLRVRKNSKSGHTGVRARNGKWFAELTVQKKKITAPICATLEEAVAARKQLEKLHWGAP